MALTMGTNGPLRLSEICPALVTLLAGPAAAASSEIVSERAAPFGGTHTATRVAHPFTPIPNRPSKPPVR